MCNCILANDKLRGKEDLEEKKNGGRGIGRNILLPQLPDKDTISAMNPFATWQWNSLKIGGRSFESPYPPSLRTWDGKSQPSSPLSLELQGRGSTNVSRATAYSFHLTSFSFLYPFLFLCSFQKELVEISPLILGILVLTSIGIQHFKGISP